MAAAGHELQRQQASNISMTHCVESMQSSVEFCGVFAVSKVLRISADVIERSKEGRGSRCTAQ